MKGIFKYINESDTSFLDCKHKHMLQKMELHLTNFVTCTHVLHIKFHGFKSRIDFSGLAHFASWY